MHEMLWIKIKWLKKKIHRLVWYILQIWTMNIILMTTIQTTMRILKRIDATQELVIRI